MKQLIFFLLLISNLSFSQIEIYNLGLTDTTQKVMYEYCENEFKVYGIDIDSTYNLIHDQDTLDYYQGIFHLQYFKSKCDTLKLYKRNVLLKSVCVSQRELPELNFYLGDLRDSIVTKEELIYALENYGILVTYAPEFSKCNSIVKSVGVTFIKKANGKVIKLYNKSYIRKVTRYSNRDDEKWIRKYKKGKSNKYLGKRNSLSEIQIDKIKKMKSGDILHLQLVKVHCPTCSSKVYFTNLKFKIK